MSQMIQSYDLSFQNSPVTASVSLWRDKLLWLTSKMFPKVSHLESGLGEQGKVPWSNTGSVYSLPFSVSWLQIVSQNKPLHLSSVVSGTLSQWQKFQYRNTNNINKYRCSYRYRYSRCRIDQGLLCIWVSRDLRTSCSGDSFIFSNHHFIFIINSYLYIQRHVDLFLNFILYF